MNQDEADMPSLVESYQSYDQSRSFQVAGASKSNVSSFSVYEDSVEQSSLAPFHDSWANSCKDASSKQPGSLEGNTAGAGANALGHEQQKMEKESGMVYHAALGVPLDGDGLAGGPNMSVVDQSFTQVGICHPKHAPKVSTPTSKGIGELYMY